MSFWVDYGSHQKINCVQIRIRVYPNHITMLLVLHMLKSISNLLVLLMEDINMCNRSHNSLILATPCRFNQHSQLKCLSHHRRARFHRYLFNFLVATNGSCCLCSHAVSLILNCTNCCHMLFWWPQNNFFSALTSSFLFQFNLHSEMHFWKSKFGPQSYC